MAKILPVCGAFVVGVALSFVLTRLPGPAGGRSVAARADSRRADYAYNRIICMSPAISEIVFWLGAGARVVGVSQHTKYPPEALAKPTCGGFFNPSYEQILALQPDLLITQGEAVKLTHFGRANGIEIVKVVTSDLESIFTETKRLGSLLQLEPEAELLCAEMRWRLAQVRARVARKAPVRVVLVIGREPGTLNNIHVVGPGTFLDDLVSVSGGRNVFSDLGRSYAVVSKEALLERAPDVVVELHGEGADEEQRQDEVRKLWQGLAPLPAVRNGRVYVIEATYAMIPGPRVIELAERLADLFHGGER